MQINIIHVNGTNLALIESDQLIIGDMQDALDLLASCNYQVPQRSLSTRNIYIPIFLI